MTDRNGCPCVNPPVLTHRTEIEIVEDLLWDLLGSVRPDMEDEEAVPIVRSMAERLRLREK